MGKYDKGEQPCGCYTPQQDGNPYGVWNNEHCCLDKCEGTRSFCINCYRDHHSDGWEACKAEAGHD